MMAASILGEGPVRLEGVPRLADVDTLRLVLERLGVEVTPTEDNALLLQTVDPRPVRAKYDLVRRMRASFCVLGPLLARRGRAVVSLPGGCNIGERPVNLHLKGLAALGAKLRLEHGYVVARADRLTGTEIFSDAVSHGFVEYSSCFLHHPERTILKGYGNILRCLTII